MKINSAPSQVATDALQALPFSNIIGAPLEACIKAQAMAAQTTWKFIQEVGMQDSADYYLEQGIDKKEAMKKVAKDRGISKRDVYQELI